MSEPVLGTQVLVPILSRSEKYIKVASTNASFDEEKKSHPYVKWTIYSGLPITRFDKRVYLGEVKF